MLIAAIWSASNTVAADKPDSIAGIAYIPNKNAPTGLGRRTARCVRPKLRIENRRLARANKSLTFGTRRHFKPPPGPTCGDLLSETGQGTSAPFTLQRGPPVSPRTLHHSATWRNRLTRGTGKQECRSAPSV